MRWLLWLLAPAVLAAEPVTLTFRRGEVGYDGAADTYLYAPASVAEVNFGGYETFGCGLNRWREQLVALVRFDLRELPPGTRVTAAELLLQQVSPGFPARDVRLEAQVMTPANAGWAEGDNASHRTPLPGTATWAWRRQGAQRWAGEAGLRRAGVDYLTPPAAAVAVARGSSGTLTLPLRPEVVEAWIREPASNAGLRLHPTPATEPGDAVYWASSEAVEVAARPALRLTLDLAPDALPTLRRGRVQRALDRSAGRLEEVAAQAVGARTTAVLTTARARLATVVRDLAAATLDRDEAAEALLQACDTAGRALDGWPRALVLDRLAARQVRRGRPGAYALVVADSMTNVLRDPRYLTVGPEATADLELAQNEFEAVQVAIVPLTTGLTGVTWAVSDLRGRGGVIPAADLSVQPVGYLRARKPAVATAVEWWPSPILDFLTRLDVPREEVQPLWVLVRTRPTTPAGVYEGAVTVRPANAPAQQLPLRVRVFDYAVPVEQHLRTVWGNTEASYRPLYGDRWTPARARAMHRFLLDHRLAVNDLYSAQTAGPPIGPGFYTDCRAFPSMTVEDLRGLWAAGSRYWNLGYLHPVHPPQAGLSFDEYVPRFIAMMRSSLAFAEAAGWPRENLGVYFFDETKDFAALHRAASQVKAAFPDIRLLTTGYDRSYGVKQGPIDASIDDWCPLTPRFVEDAAVIAAGRKVGKRAWWYVCCVPAGDRSLNFFSQYPAIRSRLLMGAATWKHQPDGFLYYRISGWRDYRKPLDRGPLTDWTPYFLPGPDGDGQLICPGPNGPLTTLQFENLRDGLEDFETWWVLSELVRKARDRGLETGAEAELLTVPTDLLESVSRYSEDPARLRAERRRLAAAIVALRQRLENAR